MSLKNINNLQRSFDASYLSGSIENLINELERVKALYVAEGVPAENVYIDIELESVPYEDREAIGVTTRVRSVPSMATYLRDRQMKRSN